MIIFDLDGTLADCDHRRHFVDPSKRDDCVLWMSGTTKEVWLYKQGWDKHETRKKFKPDWKSFYEACDQDKPNLPVVFQFYSIKEKLGIEHPIEIWSGRCESVREKTENWLKNYISRDVNWKNHLKMRPKGDSTPDDQLKERWFDELLAAGKTVDYVFDDDFLCLNMWRRRGIFVFGVNKIGN